MLLIIRDKTTKNHIITVLNLITWQKSSLFVQGVWNVFTIQWILSNFYHKAARVKEAITSVSRVVFNAAPNNKLTLFKPNLCSFFGWQYELKLTKKRRYIKIRFNKKHTWMSLYTSVLEKFAYFLFKENNFYTIKIMFKDMT